MKMFLKGLLGKLKMDNQPIPIAQTIVQPCNLDGNKPDCDSVAKIREAQNELNTINNDTYYDIVTSIYNLNRWNDEHYLRHVNDMFCHFERNYSINSIQQLGEKLIEYTNNQKRIQQLQTIVQKEKYNLGIQ